MLSCPGFMVLVTWVKFLGEKLKVTIPLYTHTRTHTRPILICIHTSSAEENRWQTYLYHTSIVLGFFAPKRRSHILRGPRWGTWLASPQSSPPGPSLSLLVRAAGATSVTIGRSIGSKSERSRCCQRRDRGIYSIWGGRSLYFLHFGISQLMGPEACLEIFVRVWLGWLSNRSLYQTFPVHPSLLYQAVGTQANVAKIPFKFWSQIE